MSKHRMSDMIRNCPQLSSIHHSGKQDATFEKFFAGIPSRFAWAGSPTKLAAHPVCYVFSDEIDRWIGDVGGEGDPLEIVRARMIAYKHTSLLIATSSPTIDGESRIQSEFDSGSMEVCQWACPECGHYHQPLSTYLDIPEGTALDEVRSVVRYACPGCGTALDDEHKDALIDSWRFWRYGKNKDAEYIPREASDQAIADRSHRSFWISGFFGRDNTFAEVGYRLAAARSSGEQTRVQGCINTQFGELYASRGDKIEPEEVWRHVVEYTRGSAPYGVQRVIMSVDVQRKRLYYVVRGFGAERGEGESWLIDWGTFEGDTAYGHVWEQLKAYIDDPEHRIARCFIDSGYKPGMLFSRPTSYIYQFCAQSGGKCYPTKGHRTWSKPADPRPKDVTLSGRVRRGATRLVHVDTTYFKTRIQNLILSHAHELPDLWHVPQNIDDDYARQVTAEEWVVKLQGESYFHCPSHRDNHFFDCEVLCEVGHHLMNGRTKLKALGPAEPIKRPGERVRTARRGSSGIARPGLI